MSLSLDDLKKMHSTEAFIAGFECSGNRRPLQASPATDVGLASLRTVLDKAGVKRDAQEFVFFGADHGEGGVEFRTNKYKVEQQFGRSLSREKALSPEPFLAYALNGEPLHQAPGRPAAPARAGLVWRRERQMAVEFSCRQEQYPRQIPGAGTHAAGEMIDGEMKWKETAVTHMQLKSFIARVSSRRRRPQSARRR